MHSPIRFAFSSTPAAIAKTTSEPDEVRPLTQPRSNGARDFVSETLVTDADPCQTAVVRYRASKRRNRHPRSGTGKRQTIAHIIGDHLARGERLFVCDKRTAIDVVKYRLETLSLGALCGVVHDLARPGSHFTVSCLRHRPRAANY